MSFSLSPYSDIYDLIIPNNDPLRMFKYLLLKNIYNLSDVDLVERSRYDMSFKYFLDMAPEEDVIHPSSLTQFHKYHLLEHRQLARGLLLCLICRRVSPSSNNS